LLDIHSLDIDYRDADFVQTSIIGLNYLDEYIQIIETCDMGGDWLNSDTVVSKRSYNAAIYSTGSNVDATTRCYNGEYSKAFYTVRSHRHLVCYFTAKDFCIYNNIVITIRSLQKKHPNVRIIILECDAYHGNGTQNSFYDNE
jgi:acetoin utilization deacetylase AcuC-like enzyme